MHEGLQKLIKESEFVEFAANVDETERAKIAAKIVVAENSLGIKLPPSYVWWLKYYSGGAIYTNEVFSLYSDFEAGVSYPGDIVYNALKDRKKGKDPNKLVIMKISEGHEVFYFNLNEVDENGEYSVYLDEHNSEDELYARTFTDFLEKLIRSYS